MNYKNVYFNNRGEKIPERQWKRDLKQLAESYMDIDLNPRGRELFENMLSERYSSRELFFMTEEEKERVMERFDQVCYGEAADEKGYWWTTEIIEGK